MKRFLFFCIVLNTTWLGAQTHTFTGNGGTIDWHTAANWSANTVPSNTSIVLIPDGFEVNISTFAVAQSLTLSGSGTLIVAANITVSETFSIENVAVLNYEQGNLSASTLDNFGAIRLLTNQQKEIINTVINNHSRMDFIDSNNIDLSGTVTINNLSEGVMDILANGGLSRQNGATTTLINDGVIKKYTENGDFGNFYMILDVINNNILEVVEDSQLLFLSPQASLHNTSTGILTGTGVFDITSSFINEGTVSPGGDEIGELSFINTFNLDGGTILVDIEDIDNYDIITVIGAPEISGDLILNQSPELEIDDELVILNSQFTIDSCSLPTEVSYANGCCDFYFYEVNCNPNDITLRFSNVILIGVDEFDNINFSITPNPIVQKATIALNITEIVTPQIDLYDITGKKVKTISLQAETTTFSRNGLAGGIYFAQLISEGKVLSTKKIILI